MTLQQDADGQPELVAMVPGETPEATETYVFTLVELSAAATPAP